MSDIYALAKVKALAFDVFGTVVDWRGSIDREAQQVGKTLNIQRDWALFADAWREGYAPAMDKVRQGALPWMTIDSLHRLILDSIVEPFGLAGLDDAQRDDLNRAWHRLQPWADSIEGMSRLKRRFTITTLSNGNFSLLTNMAKQAGLPWDCVISAELFGHYKPDPQTYQGTAKLLGIEIDELMLVAAHPSDLRAARAHGCRTAYVIRPLEFGMGHPPYHVDEDEFDLVAEDFNDLAAQLGL
ncbi:haloacid dehalogenase type II [Pseudomonas sp.]|uniref:haloacid dehalogenase type II n=1 Tax=Pseudomonas sp. TaxID=306 RepID=UPI0035677D21